MFSSHFLILILLTPAIESKIEIYNEFTSNGKSLTKCLISLIQNNIVNDDLISFYLHTNGDSSRRMTYLLQQVNKLSYPLVIRSEKHPSGHLTRYSNHADKKTRFYLIQSKYIKDLKLSLDVLRSYKQWDPLSKFVVIATTEERKHTHLDILEIINITKSFDLHNVVVVEASATNEEIHSFITYEIFDVNHYQVLDYCIKGQFINGVRLFASKVPNDLRGFPVKISTQVNPPFVMEPKLSRQFKYIFKGGLEILLTNMLGKLMNFTPEYVLPSDYDPTNLPILDLDSGEVSADGTNGTGMFESLVRNKVDLVMSALKLTENRIYSLDRMIDFYNNGYVFCGPVPKKLHTWQQILNILGPMMYCLVALLFLLVVGLLKLSKDLEHVKGSPWMFSFAVLMTVSYYRIPRDGRFIAAIWIIFSLIFSVVYQSHLYRALSEDKHPPIFRTILDAKERGYKIFLVSMTDSLYRNSVDYTDRSIASNSYFCPNDDLQKCFDELVLSRDSIMSLPKYFSIILKKTMVDATGKSMIYCFGDNIELWSTHVFMRKGYWLKPRMNYYVKQLKELGYLELWSRTVFGRLKQDKDKEEGVVKEEVSHRIKEVVFTLEQFTACFVIMGVGYMIATVAFIVEVYTWRQGRGLKKTLSV